MASRAPQGFRSQVAPRAAQPLPQVSAEARGAAVGRALQQAGEVANAELMQDREIERKLEQDRQWAEFQKRFGGVRETAAELSRTLRPDAGAGHGAAIAEQFQQLRDPALEGIDDPEVRQRAEAALDEFGVRFRTGEADFEVVAVARRNVEGFRQALDVSANRTRRLESPEDFAAELKIQIDAIDGMQTVDAVTREQLKAEAEQSLSVAYFQGFTDRDPAAAKALLETGLFDAMLTPAQVEALRNGADVEIRRAEAKAEHEQAMAVAAFRQEVATVKEAQSQGIDVTDQLADLSTRAAALGDQKLALELDGMVASNRYAKTYSGQTPVQIERAIAALRSAGALSPEKQRELKWLEDNQGSLTSGFDSDPVGFAIRQGGVAAPPAVNLQDPASVLARSKWADAYSAATGRPVPPLSKAEADNLQALLESGPQGERQTLDILGVLPPVQATRLARQINPGDRRFEIMATLPPKLRGFALRGRDVFAADRQFLNKMLKEDLDLETDVKAINAEFEGALRGLSPAARSAFKDTGLRILAGKVDKQGGGFNKAGYRRAMHEALGGTGSPDAGGPGTTGGLGRWIDDRWFLVPSGMTSVEFGTKLRQAAQQGPRRAINPDGSPIDVTRVVPVAIGGGRYRLRSFDGRDVNGSDGKVWEFTP